MANEFVARKGLVSSGSINVSGSVTASYFKGDGSQLTNLPSATVLSSSVNIDTYTFNGDGITTNYILSQSYDINSLIVSVDGLTQTKNTDYNIAASTLTFVDTPPSASNILIRALVNVTQNMTGSFSGSFFGIISTSSYAQTASYALNAGAGAGFPYSGSAVITGSLQMVNTANQGGITGSVSGALTGTFPYNSLTNIPTGIVSGATQVTPLLPTGTVSSSAQINSGSFTGSFSGSFNGINLTATSVTASRYTGSFTGSILANNGVVSGAAQIPALLPAGTVSSSAQVSSITASLATTGSNTFVGTETISGSLLLNADTIVFTGSMSVSGSVAITGTITGSIQSASVATTASYVIPSGLPAGTVSSSGQIDYNSIQNKLSGVVSSSAQVQPLLPAGTVSSSAQYPGWVTASSQIVVQNTTGIAAIATTGSNIFIGNQTVTGSLFTSGSNTLIGNTRLTGSFGISGSEIVQGYIQFEPVTTNIDTSISASYIYVSGSTKDLYFAQSSAGYSNVTRLRWLESNMYTGILHGGVLSSTPGSTTFNITSGSGIVVTLNASTGSAPYPTIRYVEWDTKTNIPITYSGSGKITYVGLDNSGNVVQQLAVWGSTDINQWDTQISLGVVLHLSGSVSTGVFNSQQISYGGPQKNDDFLRAFGPLKISGHTLQASGSSPTLSIKKTGGTSYREGANYVINPTHPSTVIENDITVSKIYRYYISGSTPVIDTGVAAAGYTTIDNTQYVDTATGLLATVNSNNYSIQRVFWIPNSPTNAFIVYYGNAQYSSLLNAVNAKDSEPFTEAPNTALNAIFLGYIIVQGGTNPARDLLNSSYATIIPGGLFRSVGGIASSGTSPVATALASLSDVSISGQSTGDILVYNGATWNNTKSLNGTYSLTGSLATNGGITAVTLNATSVTASLSGSGAGIYGVNYNTLSNIPSGIVSSSTQVKTLLTGGTVSSSAQYPGWVTSSSQIDYNSIQNKLSGVISSSTQFNALTGTSASFATTASAATSITFTPATASFATTASYALTSAGGGGSSVTVSATAPVGPSAGNMWWNSTLGKMFIYYNDGDTSQWVEDISARSGTNIDLDGGVASTTSWAQTINCGTA
jgi:hypothetical protein